jgi:hypothetical protein
MACWLYAERFVGGGSRDYSVFSERADVSADFHPQRGSQSFSVPTFWVADKHGAYLRNSLGSDLHSFYREDGRFLLPVHPDVVGLSGLRDGDGLRRMAQGPPLQVVPTANTRTVAVLRIGNSVVPPHFVKLHFPRLLSRFTRRLRRPMVELQLWVADELARIAMPYLPEVAGGVFGTDPMESWGYILREAAPRTGARAPFTVPLFALYADDIVRPDHPSLLDQLVARFAGSDPVAYVGKHVVEPMVRCWLDAVRRTGCIPEMHGQNTLFSFSPERAETAIVYRDCGIYVDPVVRAAAGLPAFLPRVNVLGADIAADGVEVRSLAYDSFMGHHVLDRIAMLVQRRFRIPAEPLLGVARKAFAQNGGTAVAMPRTIYYYNDAATVDGGGWRLKDTGRLPRWR